MILTDIHTHTPDSRNNAIYNCGTAVPPAKGFCSVGLHPWEINNDWQKKIDTITQAARNENIVAIGECGFDFIKSTANRALQAQIFEAHIKLSEQLQKPLIIHLVKGAEALLAAAATPHKQPWIVHGFRGKPQQAQQLLRAGIYLSFGECYNPATVALVPDDKIFIESDESSTPLQNIYASIAQARGTTTEKLATQTAENAQRCHLLP